MLPPVWRGPARIHGSRSEFEFPSIHTSSPEDLGSDGFRLVPGGDSDRKPPKTVTISEPITQSVESFILLLFLESVSKTHAFQISMTLSSGIFFGLLFSQSLKA